MQQPQENSMFTFLSCVAAGAAATIFHHFTMHNSKSGLICLVQTLNSSARKVVLFFLSLWLTFELGTQKSGFREKSFNMRVYDAFKCRMIAVEENAISSPLFQHNNSTRKSSNVFNRLTMDDRAFHLEANLTKNVVQQIWIALPSLVFC